MARLVTVLGTFETVDNPVFAELRATTAYFKKKAEDMDVFEQSMAELFIAMKRAQPSTPAATIWQQIEEKVSPQNIKRIEDEPEPDPEFVPDPLDDATQTGASD